MSSRLGLVLLASACSPLFTDLDRVIALEVTSGPEPTVEEGDTLRLTARALDAGGDSVPDAMVIWEVVDADSGQIGFDLAQDGLVTARFPSQARVQAQVEELRTDPIVLVVTPAPDSAALGGGQRLQVAATEPVSPALVVDVLDITTDPGNVTPVEGKRVNYHMTHPAPGSAESEGLFIAPDTGTAEVPASPHDLDVLSAAGTGQAQAFVYRVTGRAQPDSTIVEATTFNARGHVVPGSPIRFIVIFESP